MTVKLQVRASPLIVPMFHRNVLHYRKYLQFPSNSRDMVEAITCFGHKTSGGCSAGDRVVPLMLLAAHSGLYENVIQYRNPLRLITYIIKQQLLQLLITNERR